MTADGFSLSGEADETHSGHRPSSNPLVRFLGTWVFSRDHKMIGLQFLFSSLIWLMIGGLLALAIRWQLAWPWTEIPIIGRALFAAEGGQITPQFYNVLFTMHATIMVFFVVVPILTGAFGNYLIPLMIGARDMAFPTMNMLSYWLMWPAFGCMIWAMATPEQGPDFGWTAYPPLSVLFGDAQSLWTLGLVFVGISSMLGSINYITTVLQLRAPGMSLFRMPMTVWGLFITAILQAFALPVLTAALVMLLLEKVFQTGFFLPNGLEANAIQPLDGSGGQPLLWQHLFWFYSHPAVYIMVLPAMGMVSDMLSCGARKPLFGYRPMIYSMIAISGLGFIVWGHHMFVSGMSYFLSVSFMISTMLIALPSGVKVFNWLGTIWGGKLRMDSPTLFGLGFISMFIIGGLSGLLMAATPVDMVITDTYFIVAHFHYVLFGSSILGVFGAIYFWFPKMFGRMMNDFWGQVHFFLSFIFVNGTFFPMHFLGARGFLRRTADPYVVEGFRDLLPLNQFITWCAMGMAAAQLIFLLNFLGSLFWGRKAEDNPWRANSLEWTVPNCPPHGNFASIPQVYRGPYEYSHPGHEADYWPQSEAPV